MKVDQTTIDLLHPARFSDMSPRMAAFVGWLVEASYTEPNITNISITSDGFMLCQRSGDIGHSSFEGAVSELESNLTNLFEAASLSDEQKKAAWAIYHEKVQDWRIK